MSQDSEGWMGERKIEEKKTKKRWDGMGDGAQGGEERKGRKGQVARANRSTRSLCEVSRRRQWQHFLSTYLP